MMCSIKVWICPCTRAHCSEPCFLPDPDMREIGETRQTPSRTQHMDCLSRLEASLKEPIQGEPFAGAFRCQNPASRAAKSIPEVQNKRILLAFCCVGQALRANLNRMRYHQRPNRTLWKATCLHTHTAFPLWNLRLHTSIPPYPKPSRNSDCIEMQPTLSRTSSILQGNFPS